jgi:uncharacterized protein YhjY with autotransporter beta-barrel domain
VEILDIYVLFRSNPDNDSVADAYFCTQHNIPLSSLRKLKKKYPRWAKKALEARREAYAEQMTEVDKALFTAAKSGDTKAADLLYRRFDGWNPKVVEQTNNFYNFSDIVKELKNGIKSGRRPASSSEVL